LKLLLTSHECSAQGALRMAHAVAQFQTRRADSFTARMQRARNEGYSRGAREAKPFKLAVGKVFDRAKTLDWLSTAIDDGRAELESQHALEREIEAWDMSCRIAFLVAIV
jgi:hypothetical protein